MGETVGGGEKLKGMMLQGCRALDLTDRESQLCGRILADLGAEVIRVERPGGDASRLVGPFANDEIDPEKNLLWYCLNANKKGITLNLETVDGRKLFRRLVARADFVIESFPAGRMVELGLDYSVLSALNPKLIMTSISPFGQTGPYRYFKATELTLLALGVFMFGTGDPDRPPVKPNFPLAGVAAAIQSAGASMIAHYYCLRSGKGQYIDVSTQASIPWFTGTVGPWWQMQKKEIKRPGPYNARRPDLRTRFIWPCKDGCVVFQLFGGVVGVRSNKAIAKWIIEEGMGDDFFRSIDWDEIKAIEQGTQEMVTRLEESIGPFFLTKTRAELARESIKRGILLGDVDSLEELQRNPQLAEGYWREIDHPELGRALTYPGMFVRSSAMECGIRKRAPRVGEHNAEIYGGIGISQGEMGLLNQAGVI